MRGLSEFGGAFSNPLSGLPGFLTSFEVLTLNSTNRGHPVDMCTPAVLT
jgi:hypothetical protein